MTINYELRRSSTATESILITVKGGPGPAREAETGFVSAPPDFGTSDSYAGDLAQFIRSVILKKIGNRPAPKMKSGICHLNHARGSPQGAGSGGACRAQWCANIAPVIFQIPGCCGLGGYTGSGARRCELGDCGGGKLMTVAKRKTQQWIIMGGIAGILGVSLVGVNMVMQKSRANLMPKSVLGSMDETIIADRTSHASPEMSWITQSTQAIEDLHSELEVLRRERQQDTAARE